MEGGPLIWVATHRKHHQFADKDGDPHSPRDGKWRSYAGWILMGNTFRQDVATLKRYVPSGSCLVDEVASHSNYYSRTRVVRDRWIPAGAVGHFFADRSGTSFVKVLENPNGVPAKVDRKNNGYLNSSSCSELKGDTSRQTNAKLHKDGETTAGRPALPSNDLPWSSSRSSIAGHRVRDIGNPTNPGIANHTYVSGRSLLLALEWIC